MNHRVNISFVNLEICQLKNIQQFQTAFDQDFQQLKFSGFKRYFMLLRLENRQDLTQEKTATPETSHLNVFDLRQARKTHLLSSVHASLLLSDLCQCRNLKKNYHLNSLQLNLNLKEMNQSNLDPVSFLIHNEVKSTTLCSTWKI